MASPSAGAPALKYGDVITVTPSPGKVKGLIHINTSLIEHNEFNTVFLEIIPPPRVKKMTLFLGGGIIRR